MSRVISWVAALSLLSCTPIEPEKGYGYLCSRETGPADQCPGDFHCGLEGRCLKNQPGTYQCESDIDCYGWHCGVAKRCYDLADAGAESCRDDSDCNGAAGWRCDPDSKCVDAAEDGPRFAAPLGGVPAGGRRRLWTGTPTHLDGRTESYVEADGGDCPLRSVVLVSDGTLAHFDFPSNIPTSCSRRGARPPVAVTDVRTVVTSRGEDFVLLRDGSLHRVQYSQDSGVLIPLSEGTSFDRLRADDDGMVAFNGSRLFRWSPGSSWTSMVDAGVRDVALVGGTEFLGTMVLLTGDTTYAVTFADGGLTSELRPGLLTRSGYCEAGRVQDVERLIAGNIAIFDVASGPSSRTLSWYESAGPDDGGCALSVHGASYELKGQESVPAGCDVSFASVYSERRTFGCVGDGGLTSWTTAPSEWLTVPEIAIAATNGPLNDGLYAGEFPVLRGQWWSSPSVAAVPLIFDRAPDFVAEIQGDRLAVSRTPLGGDVRGLMGVVDGDIVRAMGNYSDSPFPVRGRPSWLGVIFEGQTAVYFDYRSGALLPDSSLLSDDISQAAVSDLPDGGVLMIVARGDALGHIRMRGTEFIEPLRAAVVPSSKLRITAVDLPHGLTGAKYAGGYAVAGGRVFRFRADNEVVWRSTEFVLGDGEAIDVWHDGVRARAGMRDGQVFALPSRVPIAPPTGSAARDFLQVCERLFVATADGVEQLVVAEGSTSGVWHPVETRPGAAKLFFSRGVLTIFRDDGDFGELPIPDCAD